MPHHKRGFETREPESALREKLTATMTLRRSRNPKDAGNPHLWVIESDEPRDKTKINRLVSAWDETSRKEPNDTER